MATGLISRLVLAIVTHLIQVTLIALSATRYLWPGTPSRDKNGPKLICRRRVAQPRSLAVI